MPTEPRSGPATRDLDDVVSIDIMANCRLSAAIKNIADDLSDALTAIGIYINAVQHDAQTGETLEGHRMAMTRAAGQMVRSAKALHLLHDLAGAIQREPGKQVDSGSID